MNILAVGKGRRPKFELHLKIYDLNNVPLVSGQSYIKWHLSHSMHAEHRGRTSKCTIANHKVEYGFSKVVPSIRIAIDKNNCLSECPIELEVVQEFAVTEKVTLGQVRLNLSEYVEESENMVKDVVSPGRGRTSNAGLGTTNAAKILHDDVQDGIVRRYLMQESKVNSTLKIGILLVQKDGDRNFSAPALRTAPVFGGIAGFAAGDQVEDESGPTPSISKPRDTAEIQDLYRRTLAASWYRQADELPADECIEDIFSGGNGWRTKFDSLTTSPDTESPDEDGDSPGGAHGGTLRPRDFRRMGLNLHVHQTPTQQHPHRGLHHHHHHHHRGHRRSHSASSDKSVSTVTGKSGIGHAKKPVRLGRHDSGESRERESASRSRGSSLVSVTPTLGSEGSSATMDGRSRRVREKEIDEDEVRDDLVAWRLPGALTAA